MDVDSTNSLKLESHEATEEDMTPLDNNNINEEAGNGYTLRSLSDEEDDDYILSDEEDSYSSSHETPRIDYNTPLSERLHYLTSSLDIALDSLELDKSLVIQAQLSGLLNNESQKIIEKQEILKQKIQLIKLLYRKNFTPLHNEKLSVIQKMQYDLKDIESRIKILKHGKSGLFTKTEGFISKFPVEYNKAKDKILERTLDEIVYE